MEFPSGQYVASDHWDDNMQKAMKCKESSTVNGMLDTIKANINQAVSQLFMSKAEVSLDNIRLLLKGEAVCKSSA